MGTARRHRLIDEDVDSFVMVRTFYRRRPMKMMYEIHPPPPPNVTCYAD